MRALLIAILAGGCSAGPDPNGQDMFEPGTRVHAMPLSNSLLHAPPAPPSFNYYGGPVLSNVKVVEVPWGGGVRFASYLGTFYTSITNSEYFDLLAEYGTPSQRIGRGSFEAFVVDTAAPSGATVDDTQIQSELERLLHDKVIPANDADALYVVHFPPGTTVTQGGARSCVDFCAYHGSFKRNGAVVPYVVIPDLGGNCQSACGAGDDMAATTWVASHEIVQAVTDPAIGLAGKDLGAPLAWYDAAVGELSDACAGTANIETYVVQTQWSARDGKCRFGSSSTGSFALGVSPLEQTVRAGTSATLLVTTTATEGMPPVIALAATGLPSGVTASFAPATVVAGRTSVMTLAAAAAAPGALTDVTIQGTAGDEREWATAKLTVVGQKPVNDFTLAVAPVSQTVQVGSTTTFTVTTQLASGSAESIVLGASGLPNGVTVSFVPPSVSAGGTSRMTVTASASAAVGSALIVVTGTAHSNSHTANASLDVQAIPPDNDFMLAIAPPAQTVEAGAQTSFTVSTAVTSGAAQAIALSVSGLPAGVTGSFTPGSVQAGAGATLTLSAADGAAPVSGVAFTITGTAASGRHTTTATVTVVPPPPVDDFTIAVTPGSRSVQAGKSTTYLVTTAVASGNSVSVAFAISGLPAGVTASFSPTSVASGKTATLTVTTAADAEAATTQLTITGASSTTSHIATTNVTVTAPPPSDFTISVTPPSQTIAGGESANYVVATGIATGDPVSIALSVTGLPAGVTASFMSATVDSGGSTGLTLTAMPGAAAALATFTVTGSGNGFDHSASASITVTPPPVDDFSIAIAPTSATLMAGNQASFAITTMRTSGGDQTLSLSITGLPDGVTAMLDATSITTGDPATLTLTADPGAPSATATFTVSATAASGTHAAMVDLTVEALPPPTLIQNGDFETGDLTGWTVRAGQVAISSFSTMGTVHGGTYSALIGSKTSFSFDSTLVQAIDVPATGTTTLSFWAYRRCPDSTGVQEAYIVDDQFVQVLDRIFEGCVGVSSGSWVQKTDDLTPYAGTTVNFYLRTQPDSLFGDPLWFYIDDVVVTNQ
jgi:hypothetical protein